MNQPLAVYRRLYQAYGPQGWWPTTISMFLLRGPTYHPRRYGGLSDRERSEICMGAILTQNTNWANVEKALGSLHQAEIWTFKDVAKTPRGRLSKLIRSSGYFRQKSLKLMTFAAYLISRGQSLSAWLSRPSRELREELLSLWGIGPETADSILLYAGNHPVFVIDAYTLRIAGRIGWFLNFNYDKAASYFIQRLPKSPKIYNEFHALLVKLGKEYCRTDPVCQKCVLAEVCRYGKNELEKRLSKGGDASL
ncbi:MAG: hypothetical protein ACYCPQ_04135 [Elusimicrobiota bacterium]